MKHNPKSRCDFRVGLEPLNKSDRTLVLFVHCCDHFGDTPTTDYYYCYSCPSRLCVFLILGDPTTQLFTQSSSVPSKVVFEEDEDKFCSSNRRIGIATFPTTIFEITKTTSDCTSSNRHVETQHEDTKQCQTCLVVRQ